MWAGRWYLVVGVLQLVLQHLRLGPPPLALQHDSLNQSLHAPFCPLSTMPAASSWTDSVMTHDRVPAPWPAPLPSLPSLPSGASPPPPGWLTRVAYAQTLRCWFRIISRMGLHTVPSYLHARLHLLHLLAQLCHLPLPLLRGRLGRLPLLHHISRRVGRTQTLTSALTVHGPLCHCESYYQA